MSREEGVDITLRVAEAKQQRDVGRGIARIDSNAMKTIGVTAGDVVEIQGKKATPAKVWPAYPEDQGEGLIRIDGFIRKNCGASLNEYITVKKAETEYAAYVKLAPEDTNISVDQDFVRYLKARLIDRPMIRGDTILIMMLGHLVPFSIVSTKPTGIVKILPSTEIEILGKPFTPPYAAYVKLAPGDTSVSVDPDFVRYVKDRLLDRPVTLGDTVLVRMLDRSVPFLVVSTKPSGIVKISQDTEVDILGKPSAPLVGSSKVTSRGRITIPKEVMEKYKIRPGDTIHFLEEHGKLILMIFTKKAPPRPREERRLQP